MRLAARQHRVVAHWQLVDLGLLPSTIAYRVAQGWLHPVHRGVYAVGTPGLDQCGRWMAAVLACGAGAASSFRSAGALHALIRSTAVEVTVPNNRRRRDGIVVHRAGLPADEITAVDGIPVTTVARTLLDLAAVLPSDRLERALHEAEARGLGDHPSLPDLLHRYPRRAGTRVLRAILADARLGLEVTKEEFEHRFKQYIRELGLDRPRFNVWIEGHECDVVWPEARLIVELDGRATHHTAKRFEADRARDRALMVAGWDSVRVTWRQLHEDPDALARDLRELTAPYSGGASGRARRRAPAPRASTPASQST